MSNLYKLKQALEAAITLSPDKIKIFFKTDKGEYAEGDMFLGITVPNLRKIAKEFSNLSIEDLQLLLNSNYNEERLLALIILVNQYQKSDVSNKDKIYQFYLQNTKQINNWNLVDSSAHHIVGAHIFSKEKDILLTLVRSSDLWERRIAIIATWYFIRQKEIEWTFKLAEILLTDKHDLIHKAVGWMLREAGKKDKTKLILFLNDFAHKMPRTMLRYSIEKFSEDERKGYLRRTQKAPLN